MTSIIDQHHDGGDGQHNIACLMLPLPPPSSSPPLFFLTLEVVSGDGDALALDRRHADLGNRHDTHRGGGIGWTSYRHEVLLLSSSTKYRLRRKRGREGQGPLETYGVVKEEDGW